MGQVLARHLRVPGIVLLLLIGVGLGPDAAGLIDPELVRPAIHGLVGFAVAIILFEGGLNLDLKRLRREAQVIQRLITIGALVTAVGGTLVGRLVLEWEWRSAILFGTLVIVTGPTVITPLLRRIRVRQNVETILEAEGVFIDAVGAIIAVVALQVALQPSGTSLGLAIPGVLGRLLLGAVFGFIGGAVIAFLLRRRRLVPEGLENIFVLGFAVLLFHVSNLLLEESGIGAVTVAGVVVGNVRTRISRDLADFKEQLTVFFIGLLFVLLAADVRLEQVKQLGVHGLWAVALLMLVVRPLNVLAATARSSLTVREKVFLSWMGPRGIVAAAVASLFAQTLADHHLPGGQELQAMVFLVIASTVVVQGLSGGLLARALGLSRPSNRGFVIMGASDLGRALGTALAQDRGEIVFVDSNSDATLAAQREGFKVIFGSGLRESTLARAQVDSRRACIAVTTNEEVNLLFARNAREEFKVPRVYVGLQRGHASVTVEMVHAVPGRVLFGRNRDLELWDVRFRRALATVEIWERTGTVETEGASAAPDEENGEGHYPGFLLPMVFQRGNRRDPVDEEFEAAEQDRVWFAIFEEQRERAVDWLRESGWTRQAPVQVEHA
ncbi:MAG: cation:proton antiporter [Candidatus Eisenbacteria bacterium]|uniref:Cation:proton antiporter n=1 Tax=Eiseniibacteriota bacterium TaxID=2212470 RepID=A0A956M099_UNCEI|nr:cation:proton antiporter [Candidatus Eisenbacteria bacterium]